MSLKKYQIKGLNELTKNKVMVMSIPKNTGDLKMEKIQFRIKKNN